MKSANSIYNRLKMLQTAVAEMIAEVEKEITPPPPRKRTNRREERMKNFEEFYEFGNKGKKKPAPQPGRHKQ